MPKPITTKDRAVYADRERDEVLIDLRAMLDQHRTLIARGAHYRPPEQLKMLKRRRAALQYAINCITETEEP